MVERGGCSFVTKARNIAHAGGKAAIIVDNKYENITELTMSDDGTGAGLRIPAVMISKKDGEILISFMKDAELDVKRNIGLNINFMKPHPQEVPDFTFWYTSADLRSRMFLQDMEYLILPILHLINF